MNTGYADEPRVLNDDGSVPSTRMQSADECIDRVKALQQADSEGRSYRRKLVKGLVDGNPPYSSTDLIQAGRSYQCNVNWRVAESYLNQVRSSYYDVFSEAPTFATVTCSNGTPDQQATWSGVVTEEFDRLQRTDASTDYHMQISQYEMVLYGCGPLIFPDDYTWREDSVLHKDLLVPDMAKSDPNAWEECAVLVDYLPSQLYGFIRNEEQATKMGWNVAAVKKSIINAHPKSQGEGSFQTWEYHQQQLKNSSYSYNTESRVIPCAHYLFREFPESGETAGKITHVLIPMSSATQSTKADKGSVQFLMQRERRFDQWTEFIHPMYCDNDGGGYHHSVTGLGVKMYSAMAYQNRLLCNIADKAFAPKLFFKPMDAASAAEWDMIVWGDYARMPAGFEIAQTPVGSFLEDVLTVNREFTGLISSNLSQYKSAVTKESGNPITATEMQFRASEQARLGKTQLNHYYQQLDRFYAEKFRRAVACPSGMPGGKEAQEFRNRCKERGVPLEALKWSKAKATRIVGQGSQFMRQQALQNLLASVALWPSEKGRTNLLADYVAAFAGQTMVQRYIPTDTEATNTSQEVTATLQVAAAKQGVTPVVTGEQNPAVFAPLFIAASGQALQSVQQGGDPVGVVGFVQTIAPAVEAHLQRLGADPTRKAAAQGLTQQWKQIAQTAQQLQGQIEQAAQQQQQQAMEAQQAQMQAQSIASGVDPKTQIKAAETAAKIQMQQEKTNAGMAMKAQKHTQDMALADASTAAEISRQQQKLNAQANEPKPSKPKGGSQTSR